MMFEILMGLAILWQAWLLASIMDIEDEDAYGSRMFSKSKRDKALSDPVDVRNQRKGQCL